MNKLIDLLVRAGVKAIRCIAAPVARRLVRLSDDSNFIETVVCLTLLVYLLVALVVIAFGAGVVS